MPWEKQFDESAALDKAMQAFWAHGYEATSIQDLVDAMGLHRGSIYAAFGSKRQLFIRALAYYEVEHRRAWLQSLKEHHGPRAAILAVFEGAIGAALSDRSRSGCLLVNTAVELSPHDPEIAETVAKGLRETEDFFRELILDGQRNGEIKSRIDPIRTAQALLGLLAGLRVLSRSRPEPGLLEAIADQADAILR